MARIVDGQTVRCEDRFKKDNRLNIEDLVARLLNGSRLMPRTGLRGQIRCDHPFVNSSKTRYARALCKSHLKSHTKVTPKSLRPRFLKSLIGGQCFTIMKSVVFHDLYMPDARYCRKVFYLSAVQEPQNGLAMTRITMIAEAIPGTSLNNRSCLPVRRRSPRASFLA